MAHPVRSHSYGELNLAPMREAVPDLEAEYRRRLAGSPRSPPAIAARTIGWLFGGWGPDDRISRSGFVSYGAQTLREPLGSSISRSWVAMGHPSACTTAK